ncbi:porin family protein [Pontibacter actiniarum]|uniref:Outer membrane protein beta-barrel domain-containing protein n=1 Tax=Pontibacter actiniarum TaxID=323450 RepID=A0A1X9YTS3_9BACT|nr:porin family protein [Pontibacter actiniarum]ARS36204.1 hypothetical protein CA264_12590 [Pontibacter actiniarum]
MKHLYATLLLLLTLAPAFAQQDFRKGFIVQNGDTLRGYIDYRGDRRNAQFATFKQTLQGPEQRFTPEDISAYGYEVEQKLFESKTILPASETEQAQRHFLKTLIKGKASLYQYRDAADEAHYYLSMENGPLLELTQTEYTRKDPKTGRTYNATNKVFVGTLGNAFADCPNLKEAQLKNLELKESSLAAITRQYNMCVAPASVQHEQKKVKSKLTVGPVAAFYSTSLNFTGDTYLRHAPFENNVNVGGGLAFNATLPKLNEKLSVQMELLYIASNHTATFTEEGQYGSSIAYDVSFDLAHLKLPVQLRYTLPRGLIQPYFNAGVVVGYAVKDANEVTKVNTLSGSTTYSHTYPAIPGNGTTDGFRSFMEGITAGAGLTYPLPTGTLSLEARYEANNGISSISGIKSIVSTVYVLVGYGF